MKKVKANIPPEIRAYMSEIGKRGGSKNKEKGKEYFANIRNGLTWKEIQEESKV